jgi:hypothetical protein
MAFGLDSLPSLGQLGDLFSSTDPLKNPVGIVGSTVASAVTGKPAQDPLTKYVMIIVGLLLVAAGIFGFDKVRETVVQTGKAVAVAA